MIINVLFGQKNVDGTITVHNVHNDQTTSTVPEVYIFLKHFEPQIGIFFVLKI